MSFLHLITKFGQLVEQLGVSTVAQGGTPRGSRSVCASANGFGLGFGPASGLGTVLVLASLALASGPARADGFRVEGRVHIDDLLVQGGYEQIAPVPRYGLEVELWSNPQTDEFVRVGERVQLYFRTNENCYVTLISVDADGRARRIFPQRGDDGWVQAGRVQALPGRWDDYDLRFTGPIGEEYVFAVASLDPIARYYPTWLSVGAGPSWEDCRYSYGRSDLFDTGWCVGDPIPEIYRFTERLVPFPHRRDTYAATWIRFDVGRRHVPTWRICNDCGGRIGHGHDCGHGYVEISIGIGRGVCDFYRPCPPPRYRHVVCRTVEPRRWNRVFHEPVQRWRSPGDVGRAGSPVRSRDKDKEIHRRESVSGKAGMTPEEYRRMRDRGVEGATSRETRAGADRSRNDRSREKERAVENGRSHERERSVERERSAERERSVERERSQGNAKAEAQSSTPRVDRSERSRRTDESKSRAQVDKRRDRSAESSDKGAKRRSR